LPYVSIKKFSFLIESEKLNYDYNITELFYGFNSITYLSLFFYVISRKILIFNNNILIQLNKFNSFFLIPKFFFNKVNKIYLIYSKKLNKSSSFIFKDFFSKEINLSVFINKDRLLLKRKVNNLWSTCKMVSEAELDPQFNFIFIVYYNRFFLFYFFQKFFFNFFAKKLSGLRLFFNYSLSYFYFKFQLKFNKTICIYRKNNSFNFFFFFIIFLSFFLFF
jgi:hypothetical protein